MKLISAIALFLLATCLIQGTSPVEARQPNIVYIISDDHDYEHLGFMGNKFVHTPTIDELARQGTVFTTVHLPMSRCHPTLASFLSGQWPHQSGIYYNYGTKKLSPKNSLPNLLKEAGYWTYVEGKYWEGDPREMGFTHGAGKTAKTFVRKGQDDLFAFLDEAGKDQPFFVWWAPLIPHTPHNPPQKYVDLYDWSKMPRPSYVAKEAAADIEPEKVKGKRKGQSWRQKEKLSYAMEAWLDDGIARLVDKLKANGQYDDTLFVFVIDNGWCNGRVSKGSPFEKGVRTPVFFSWPGQGKAGPIKPGQMIDELISTNDIYPTLLELADAKTPDSAAGRSLAAALAGEEADYRDALFGAIYPAFVTKGDERPERDIYAIYVRTNKWKYILYLQDVVQSRNGSYFRIQSINTDYPERKAGDEDLFAIDTDPYEENDLASDARHREQMDELQAACLKWWAETGGKPLNVPK